MFIRCKYILEDILKYESPFVVHQLVIILVIPPIVVSSNTLLYNSLYQKTYLYYQE
jgi:hypothetical protein